MPRKRINFIVTSDIKPPDKVQPWEAEILAGVADRLLAALAGLISKENNERHLAAPDAAPGSVSRGRDE